MSRRSFLTGVGATVVGSLAATPAAACPNDPARDGAMTTQVKIFSTNGAETFSNLEKEINDWLSGQGAHVVPVNSQTAICAVPDSAGGKSSQSLVIALWYEERSKRLHK
jgi:hypothetical protein